MIVTGIILLVIGVLAKNGIVWTTGFVVLILGLIALLLGMTGHGIVGRRQLLLRLGAGSDRRDAGPPPRATDNTDRPRRRFEDPAGRVP